MQDEKLNLLFKKNMFAIGVSLLAFDEFIQLSVEFCWRIMWSGIKRNQVTLMARHSEERVRTNGNKKY